MSGATQALTLASVAVTVGATLLTRDGFRLLMWLVWGILAGAILVGGIVGACVGAAVGTVIAALLDAIHDGGPFDHLGRP